MTMILLGCEKGPRMGTRSDEDSDRPAWAGGNTDENPHINRNDDAGTTRGGDYGDLYVLLRDRNGVPKMRQIGEEWYVQPIAFLNGEVYLVGDDTVTVNRNLEGDLVLGEGFIPETSDVIYIADLAPKEVDFGRLNIVRSPQSVLDQALDEALNTLEAPGAEITLDFCGRLHTEYELDGVIISKTIDSPRENMAIYQHLMRFGFTNRLGFLNTLGVDALELAASCFAAGSDKTGTIILDEIAYINGFVEAYGLCPILNEHEYDFHHENKHYYNFGDCDCDGLGRKHQYSRDVYKDRYIQFLVWDNVYYPVDENGDSDGPIGTVFEVMENMGKFMYMWGEVDPEMISGFALAADDAVQVLEFIHGDSNIRFLPNYTGSSTIIW